MAADVASEFKQHYDEKMQQLPEVCEGGQECRDFGLNDAKNNVQAEWKNTLDQIKRELENVLTLSNAALQDAYDEMAACPDGCITVTPPEEPEEHPDMVCKSNGDPHITTWSERKVDVQGHGVF